MKDKNFEVVIEKENHCPPERNILLGIKSNDNSFTNYSPPLSREELAEIAMHIIDFLQKWS